MPFETDVHLWRAGERALDDAPARDQAGLELVRDAIVAQVRRRLGRAATADDLAALYDEGTGWCLDLAARVAPEAPWAWDAAAIDAAFAQALRETTDFAGGRRIA